MKFNRRRFIQSAVAGLLLPLVEPIIEPERRIWALGAIPEPVTYSYTWTWDARRVPAYSFVVGRNIANEDMIRIEPNEPIAYEDLAYVMSRLFGSPTVQPAASSLQWELR